MVSKKEKKNALTKNEIRISALITVVFVLSTIVSGLVIFSQGQKVIYSLNPQLSMNNIQTSPISIMNNLGSDGFTAAGFSGSGTAIDPYVLENDIILSSGPPGINISNTDAYFRIENVKINGSMNSGTGGIHLNNVKNGNLVNVTVTNSFYGFLINNSENNFFIKNNASGSNSGIILYNSIHNTLSENNASGNGFGIFLYNSSNYNTLNDNLVNENGDNGFICVDSDHNTLFGNTVNENDYGGIVIINSSHMTLSNNSLADNFENLVFINSNNNFLTDNHVTGGFEGIPLVNFSNSIVSGNMVTGCIMGLGAGGSNNILIGNVVEECASIGIASSGFNNTLSGNFARRNDQNGFNITNSNYTTLTGNVAIGNSENGFHISRCNNSIFSENIASSNIIDGFYLDSSRNLTLTWNYVYNNTKYAFNLDNSNDSLIYYNSILDNNQGGISQGFDNSLSNNWTNGTHGNYWNDYSGVDAVGNDGIGETNYTLDGTVFNTNDTRPLVPKSLMDLSTLQLVGPGNQIIEAGTAGIFSISWIPTSNFPPSAYELYVDDFQTDTDAWTSGVVIELGIDLETLDLGIYNYTLTVSDYTNNTVTNTVIFTLQDTIVPFINYAGQTDLTIDENSTGNSLSVSATDLYPETYTVFINESALFTSGWTSGSALTIYLDHLAIGVYNITYIVQDTSGNEATLSIIISVINTDSPANNLDIQFLIAVTILTSGVIGIVFLFRKRR